MSGATHRLRHNVPLAALTTLRLPAVAAEWRELASAAEACAAWLEAGPPDLILGGGSNIVIAAARIGVVWHPALRERRILGNDGDYLLLRIGAGEVWDDIVAWSLAAGGYGLENLSLIPGLCGAAPIQNIGAYGVELAEFIAAIEALDLVTGEVRRFAAEECDFAYRHSRFRGVDRGRYLILAVELRLPVAPQPRLDYPGIADELQALGIAPETAQAGDIRRAVIAIRRRKLPDPGVLPNAGSFFKNPLVDPALAAALRERWPAMPAWPAAGKTKLSAAWLIETGGLKGTRHSGAGGSEQHALVLANYGNASGEDILALARRIQNEIYRRFAVELEIEPVVYPPSAVG